MTGNIPTSPRFSRRSFLYLSTALVGAAGLGAAAWPFIHQMCPDARVLAAGNRIEIDLAGMAPAQHRAVKWSIPAVPVFVTRRTPAMLAAMQEPSFIVRLADPHSSKRQQPTYAKNWHRSIDPAYAVLAYRGHRPSKRRAPALFRKALREFGADVGLDDGGIAHHLRRQPLAQLGAVMQHDDPAHQRYDDLHQVLDDDDRYPPCRNRA